MAQDDQISYFDYGWRDYEWSQFFTMRLRCPSCEKPLSNKRCVMRIGSDPELRICAGEEVQCCSLACVLNIARERRVFLWRPSFLPQECEA